MREVDNYLESGVWFWVCWEGTWLLVNQSYEIEGYEIAS
jgi:hypothetical protein